MVRVGVKLEDEIGGGGMVKSGHVGGQSSAEKVVPVRSFVHPRRTKMNEHLHVIAAPLRRVRTLCKRAKKKKKKEKTIFSFYLSENLIMAAFPTGDSGQ